MHHILYLVWVTTLCYFKWTVIRGFIFSHSFIIEHEFISKLVVVIYYFTIFQMLSILIFTYFH